MKTKLAVTVALLCLLAPSAAAHVQSEGDGDDVLGRLDIKKVSMSHDPTSLLFKITTHKGWGKKAIKGTNGGMNVYLDTAGEVNQLNYYIVFATKKGEIRCKLYNRKGDLKANGEAHKTSGTTATCEISQGDINRDGKTIRWAAQSSWKQSADTYVFDYAPNDGYLSHKVPL